MKKGFIIGSVIIIVTIVAIWFIFKPGESDTGIVLKPSYGEFRVTVTTTGELRAKKSVEIKGPAEARAVGIYQMKISKLIPEGTVVKKGDFVADLDKSEIMNQVKEVQLSIQQYESQYLKTQLDSTLNLSSARDELENLKFSMEEKKLLMEQSKYEPPATIRQAEIDYERVKRSYEQSMKNYETKVRKAITDLSIVQADLSKEQQKLARLMDVMSQFTIKAPGDGMVVYAREWNGRRITEGATVRVWDPVVAKLPDLTKMESLTFINEVDIQKIQKGQKVKIGLDAIPGKHLSGEITHVANIGEQKRNSDSKVFEVIVDVNEIDTTLRPAMTTSNEILVAKAKKKLYIPLECLHTENDTTFVFTKNGSGIEKQQVEIGLMNENEVVIERGLGKEDLIYLSLPDNAEELAIKPLEGGKND